MSLLNDIRLDLEKSLLLIDKNNYVLRSMMNHLEEECEEDEIVIIDEKIHELDIKEYESKEDFIEDYQPIFNLVDFPISECFRVMERRTLNYDNI